MHTWFSGSAPAPPLDPVQLAENLIEHAGADLVLAALNSGLIDPSAPLEGKTPMLGAWVRRCRRPGDRKEVSASWPSAEEWAKLDEADKRQWVAVRMLEMGADPTAAVPPKWASGNADSLLEVAIHSQAWIVLEALARHDKAYQLPWRKVDLSGLVKGGLIEAAIWLADRGSILGKRGSKTPAWMEVQTPAGLARLAEAGVNLSEKSENGKRAEAYWSRQMAQKEAAPLIEKIRQIRLDQGQNVTAEDDADVLEAELDKGRKGLLAEWIKTQRIDPQAFRFNDGRSLVAWQADQMITHAIGKGRNSPFKTPILSWYSSSPSHTSLQQFYEPKPGFGGLTFAQVLLLVMPYSGENLLGNTRLGSILTGKSKNWMEDVLAITEQLDPASLSQEARKVIAIGMAGWISKLQDVRSSYQQSPLKQNGMVTHPSDDDWLHVMRMRRQALKWMTHAITYSQGEEEDYFDADKDQPQLPSLVDTVARPKRSYGPSSALINDAWKEALQRLQKMTPQEEEHAPLKTLLNDVALLELLLRPNEYGDPPAVITWAIKHAQPSLEQIKMMQRVVLTQGHSDSDHHIKTPHIPSGWITHKINECMEEHVAPSQSAPKRRM